MRSIIDFYRARPLVAVLVFVIGLALAVVTAAFSEGGVVLPIAFVAFIGLLIGIIVAYIQHQRSQE
jgi:uncharacterized membrane protein